MADRPILFSAPMIRAILREIEQPGAGKTQTRRIIKPQPHGRYAPLVSFNHGRMEIAFGPDMRAKDGGPQWWRPKAQGGDRLWVRETWKPHSTFAGMKPRGIPQSHVFFEADDRYAPSNTPWVPCIHMPRWASRITLLVTGVKVERLQDISEKDAIAEGIEKDHAAGMPSVWGWRDYLRGDDIAKRHFSDPSDSYRTLWDAINGVGSGDANPWVAAYTFKPVLANIDTLGEVA